ncbi:SRPBCC family protein [Cryptosporangium aurantiacum]|uniref:Uncharacterized conserved protein YndB, AHSA1/START domain n=1 Tax=Cryptosporangium aurantiacum TaxID=134849 RepID=A0A1M7RLM1_9ACTN|nr:SRPBCC family protein [Cryptosporangium aurantiacum]SHN47154.1 Uncharacterized conserved protein YndB, AHSA1/START domain [Cryptosporangium aurantiacum]
MSETKSAAEITLPTDEQILITRYFAASPARVFRVWSTPELVRQWWSGDQGATTSVEMDFTIGGRWRYVMVAEDGSQVAFHGQYLDIVPDRTIVYTEVFEAPGEVPGGAPDGAPGEVPTNTVTFDPDGEGTLLRLLVQCPTKDLRDMIMSSGMEAGVQGQMDLIEELAGSHA